MIRIAEARNQLDLFEDFRKNEDCPLIFGHRGVPEEHQENTLAGFKRAMELGIDGAELDVAVTKDNKLVVFHDLDTERLTGVPGLVAELTWEELRQRTIKRVVNVGNRMIDYGREEKIQLLEDVLEETQGRMLIDIEIKAFQLNFGQRRTGTLVAKLIQRMGVESDVFVSSFNPWPLLWLRRNCRNIATCLSYALVTIKDNEALRLLMETSLVGKMMGSTSANMSINMFRETTINKIHKSGLAVGAWTVFSHDPKWMGGKITPEQELRCIDALASAGIDYFITDDPVRLQQTLMRPSHNPAESECDD